MDEGKQAFEDFNNWWNEKGKPLVLKRWQDSLKKIIKKTFKEYLLGLHQIDPEILKRIKDITNDYDFVVDFNKFKIDFDFEVLDRKK